MSAPEAVVPPDPFRWLETQDSTRTRRWLSRQQGLLDATLPRLPKDDGRRSWRFLLDEVCAQDTAHLVSPPCEANGTVFEHHRREDGDVLTALSPDGHRRVVLDQRKSNRLGEQDHSRILNWRVSPDSDLVAVQTDAVGREAGGLLVVNVSGRVPTVSLDDAAPHPGVSFIRDLLVYTAGTRTAQTLTSFHPVSGSVRGMPLPVTGPVRLTLRATARGRLLIRTRPGTGVAIWWTAAWSGGETPRWTRVDTGGLRVSGFALSDEGLYLAAADGVHRIRFTGPENPASGTPESGRTGTGPPELLIPARGTDTGVRELQVLPSPAGDRLAVLWQTGLMRRLEVRPVDAPHTVSAGTAGFDWPARIRLGTPAATSATTSPAVLWTIADDPRSGPWTRRIPLDGPTEPPPATRTTLTTLTARSADGTEIPVTVSGPASPLPLPLLLTVYGGFGVPLEPTWDPLSATWLHAGGRVAWVHTRGGGEFGPAWAAAGRGAGKADVVADLCAAARMLVDQSQTTTGMMGALAASNGGLVLASAVTRSPGLFSAVVCAAPLTDMARYHLQGLGAGWVGEYGDPEDPDILRALLGYSPYHRVQAGVPYPATLIVTGGNDVRVPPWHGWKFAAALQEATGSAAAPVLLDHHTASGHHGRTREDAGDLSVRILTFLADRTGLSALSGVSPEAKPHR